MSEPTGRLAYGQAGAYDAIDDRAVIAAVTRNRTGLTWTPAVTAGPGLQVIVGGGWLGVAAVLDGTSCVVGSRLDQSVIASPGPATGSREDVLWCDVEPDEGTWALVIVPASATAGRAGLPLAFITVPANATVSAQMTIRPAGANLERRLIGYAETTETNTRTGNTWEGVGTCISCDATVEPGQLYRARFTALSPMALSSQYPLASGRIGLGWRNQGGPDSASQLQRASTLCWPGLNVALGASVDVVFRHPLGSPPVARSFDGRIWIAGTGSFRTCGVTGQGPALTMAVEDLGS